MNSFGPCAALALLLLSVCCEMGICAQVQRGCDPHLNLRLVSCPEGYCCVRDEFLPSETFCKRIGVVSDSCTTRPTESACPCGRGLTCQPNISSEHLTSLYGTCKPTNTTTTTTTTTTGTINTTQLVR